MFNKVFKSEVAKIQGKWEETGLLGTDTDRYAKSCLAVLLENQKLMCDIDPKLNSEIMTKLVAEVFRNFYGSKIISMQPLLGPAGLVYYLRYRYQTKKAEPKPAIGEMTVVHAEPNVIYEGEIESDNLPEINLVIESEEICAKTRRLKSQVDGMWDQEGALKAECVPQLASLLRDEIFREICTDLRNNAATVAAYDIRTAPGDTLKEKYESLYVKLVEVSSVIHRKTLRGGANWIVTHPRIAEMFSSICYGWESPLSEDAPIQYCGAICSRWRVYADPKFNPNELLIGYKGDSFMDAGYFMTPYVPFAYPAKALSEHLQPEQHLLMRYGKKLLREGSKFYARITVQGLDEVLGNLDKLPGDLPKEPILVS